MATYSAFFSSGLLAPRIARCTTPVLPSSPVTSPVDPVNSQLSLTPTSPRQTSPYPKAPEARTSTERPRMRRRRSSINVGASPMALIKSPVRSAGAALQRNGLMSPTRHRAANVGINEALQANSLFGRLGSGSVHDTAKPSKRLRRAIRRPIPLAPPPSVPLPALPPSPTSKCGRSLLLPAILIPAPRQPLTRSSCTDNIDLFSSTLPSPTLLSPDYTPSTSFKLSSHPSTSHEDAVDEVMQED